MNKLPAAAADEDEEDSEDEQDPAGHTDDDCQLPLPYALQEPPATARVVKGEDNLVLTHPSGVDGDAGVVAEVGPLHVGDGEAVVELDAAFAGLIAFGT